MYIVLDSNVHVAMSPPQDTTLMWVQATSLYSQVLSEQISPSLKDLLKLNSTNFALSIDAKSPTWIMHEIDVDVLNFHYYDETLNVWVSLNSDEASNFILQDDSLFITTDGYIFNVKE